MQSSVNRHLNEKAITPQIVFKKIRIGEVTNRKTIFILLAKVDNKRMQLNR